MFNLIRRGHAVPTPHRFLADEGPIAVAHAGGSAERPPNTMDAFHRAHELGYRFFEVDAHATVDGVVVLSHDRSLEDGTGRNARIATLSLRELMDYDAAYAWSPDGGRSFPYRGRGVRLAELEDVLSSWPDTKLIVDVKSDECVAPLLRLIGRRRVSERICFGSFSIRRLRAIRRESAEPACTSMAWPEVAIAVAAARSAIRVPRQGANCVQVPVRQRPLRIVTEGFLERARSAHLPVHVWTVNEEAEMNRLLDLGVDGIITDELTLLKRVFAKRNLVL